MYLRDYRDILAGGLLMVLGLFVGLYAAQNYRLGTPSQMGPGMFPLWLGVLLTIIGAAILISAFFRPGPWIKPHYRQFIAVIAGILAFTLTVDVLGMIPAISLLTVAAALADDELGPLPILALSASLSVIAVLIFRFGLGIPIEPVRWPF
jgi:hypothetical protein